MARSSSKATARDMGDGEGAGAPKAASFEESLGSERPSFLPPRERRRTQRVALFLMAVATLGSAWAGFQAGLWSGIQTFRLADATKLSRLSSQNSLLASQERNLDSALFIEYARALSERNVPLATFLYDRLRPEFRPALDAWVATKPLKNKNAPATPFEMPEYQLESQRAAHDEDLQSNDMRDQAQRANRTGDSYTLAVLLFTSALFLAGLVTGFEDDRTRWITIALSLVFACLALYVMAGLSIAHRG